MEACSGAMGTAAEDVGAMEPDAVDANHGDLDRCRVEEKPIIKYMRDISTMRLMDDCFSSDELDSMTGEVLSLASCYDRCHFSKMDVRKKRR